MIELDALQTEPSFQRQSTSNRIDLEENPKWDRLVPIKQLQNEDRRSILSMRMQPKSQLCSCLTVDGGNDETSNSGEFDWLK